MSSKVTIGIPQYNEEKFIEEAIRSAAPQCDTLWISDNASTDGSAAICEKLSREYSNVHFVRQPYNLGSVANFKYLLDKADTPFFMWLGSHDALPDCYVRQLTQLLENCSEAVLAYGVALHVDVDGRPTGSYGYYDYHESLADKEPTTRILGLLRYLHDFALVYGVFRTDALRKAWDDAGIGAYIATDFILLTHCAKAGRFLYTPETHLICRDVHPGDTYEKSLKRMHARDPSSVKFPRREMLCRQRALIASVSKGTGMSGFLFRLKARAFLVMRYGPIDDALMTRNLERLFFMFYSIFLFLQPTSFSNVLKTPLPDLPLKVFKVVRHGIPYRVRKLKQLLKKCIEGN
ncbi:glycosyltransferase [Methylomonas sp. SURF-2]|uniref:Glycosyltransferase n=1 Tax=Methylomonas subterranea TaxID=2952225 RepID=A0ABT1TC84_9GAMM|nr:glycosyltransferase family 2 protein [Methylomonas sp. SURF-2]MCQ8103079.1 glycosyltransferase [Methylomonas sp. SURF-2]